MVRIARASAPPPEILSALPAFPAWARARRAPEGLEDAVFAAGAALAHLHVVASRDHAMFHLWRRRLALTNAAAVVRLQGRTEGEAALRDAWMLRRADDDPGPAGRMLGAWRALATRSALDPKRWATMILAPLGIEGSECMARILEEAADTDHGMESPVASAARVAALAVQGGRDGEVLALWLADAVLAARLKWPAPVPLLAAHLKRADLRSAALAGHDGGNWLRLCASAYAKAAADAFDLHAELARRAERLIAVSPKLRSKEAANLVAAVLSEDALAAGSATGKLSERSGRRFFDRLIELGAIRELTGRPTFRLYGL
jgi:hypothetical protein